MIQNKKTGLRIVVTGATGMVGEGVMHMCLQDPDVAEVLSVSRRPCGHRHPKLRELLHEDFFDLEPVAAQLAGYDACFFCLGVSSVGMSADDYYRYTYTLTMHFAGMFGRQSPGAVFCYISGAGTNVNGRMAWARVKGKTEQDLSRLPLKVYSYRPGFIKPVKGMLHTHRLYRFLGWLFPIGRALAPGGFCRLEELGRSMIRAAKGELDQNLVEGKDITATGK